MTLSLDTNVLIELLNGRRPRVRVRFEEAVEAGETIATCSISAHELLYGAMISARREHQLEIARALFERVAVAELTLEDVEAAAALRASLRDSGLPIGSFDTFIAGQAQFRGWTVVTANVREFGRVRGLRVVDWTADPELP